MFTRKKEAAAKELDESEEDEYEEYEAGRYFSLKDSS